MPSPQDLAFVLSLPARLQKAVDARDLAAFADCLTEDCVFIVARDGGTPLTFAGRTAICAMTEGLLKNSTRHLVHHVGSLVIDKLTASEARLSSICLYVACAAGTFQIAGLGHYADDLRRDNGKWRFTRRRIEMSMNEDMARAVTFATS